MRRDSIVVRVLGIIVFLVGVGILISVAAMTYQLFQTPSAGLQVSPAPGSATPTSALGASAIQLLYRTGLLIVLAIVGSLLAARGLHLYFVATGPSHPEPDSTSRRRRGTPDD